MPDKKRLEYLDIAKGIGIILVVLGHVFMQSPIVTWIYSFHIPLFFFLSGYLFYFNKDRQFKNFLIKKINTILIPYFVYAIVFYLYWLLAERHLRDQSGDVLKPFIGIFYGIGKEPWLTFDDALWFLTCLFVVEIVFFLLVRAIKSPAALAVVLVLSSVVGYCISKYQTIDLPWGINIAFTAIVFYGAGYLLHHFEVTRSFQYRYQWLYLPPLLALYVVCTFFNGRVDLNTLVLNHYFLFYGAAFGGLLSVYFLSRAIKKCALLRYLGASSLIIMCAHEPIKRIVIGLVTYMTKYPIQMIRDNFWGALTCTVVTLLFLTPLVLLIERYLPLLGGKQQKKI